MQKKGSEKRWDVVVLGGINTDFVVRTRSLPQPGQSVTGDFFYCGPGGKGANQAVAAAHLGARVAIIGRVGADDRGHELVSGLRRNAVDVTHVVYDKGAPTGAAIIAVDSKGEKQISVAPGANFCLTQQQIEGARSAISSARVLLMQLEVPMAAVLCAARLAAVAGTKVILDPGPPGEIPDDLFPLLEAIRPNRDEVEQLLGRKIRSRAQVRAAAKEFLRRGVKFVALEAEGDLVISAEREISVPRFQVDTVDATGAGDAFAAGLAVGVAEGRDLEEIGRLASATAALSTTKIGAQEALPTRQQVQRLLRR